MTKKHQPTSLYEILGFLTFLIVPTLASILLWPAILTILVPSIAFIAAVWACRIIYKDSAYEKAKRIETNLLAPYYKEWGLFLNRIHDDERIFQANHRDKILELHHLWRELANRRILKRAILKQTGELPTQPLPNESEKDIADSGKKISELENQFDSIDWPQRPNDPIDNNEVDRLDQMRSFINELKNQHLERLKRADQVFTEVQIYRGKLLQRLQEYEHETWYRELLNNRMNSKNSQDTGLNTELFTKENNPRPPRKT